VFVSSQLEHCRDRINAQALKGHIVTILDPGCGLTDHDSIDKSLQLLRQLIEGCSARGHSQRILPFMLATGASWSDNAVYSNASAKFLDAGVLGVAGNPLLPSDLARIVSRVAAIRKPNGKQLGRGMARRLVRGIEDQSDVCMATHRPDIILTSERRQVVEKAIITWAFIAHDLDMDELTYAAVLMLEHVLKNPELECFRLSRPQLMTFVLESRRQYGHEQNVYYHNWRHAVDVTQSLYCFLCDVHLCPPLGGRPVSKKEMNALERLFTPLDALILLVSAIGHDVGHPGVNNAFLVASNHHLAQMYNDRSVLENYHGAAYSQLLRRHWPSVGQNSRFRSTIISTILATDMQRHFEYMGQLSDLKRKVSEADEELSNWNDKDKDHAKEVAMALLIKAADISNVARPFEISAQWALVLMNEFANQGELETELQIPTCLFGGPPDKEDRVAAAQSQKGFMDVFGFPLFRGLCEVMPNVSCTLPELEKNKVLWEQRIHDETALRDAARSVVPTPPKTNEVEVDNEAAKTRTRYSEPSVTPLEPMRTSTPVIHHPSELGTASTPATRITANSQRLQVSTPNSGSDSRRPAAAFLAAANDVPNSPVEHSRRSSKDVALTQLHDYSVFAQLNMRQNFQPGDRRGSADASWAIHQSYPPSRRGSKDESLTTILVTSQPSPVSRSVPGSPIKNSKPSSLSKSGGVGLRSAQVKQSSSLHRSSAPSIPSQTVSSSATTMDQPSPATIPSSFGEGIKDDGVPPHVVLSAPADPIDGLLSAIPGKWPVDLDGTHQRSSSSPTISSSIPSTPILSGSTAQPTSLASRPTSGDIPDESSTSAADPKADSIVLRESRSRSRLRGLKFWKRRREVSGMESLPTTIASNNRSSPTLTRQSDLPPQMRASHPSLPDMPS
jgi:hypothetical protein